MAWGTLGVDALLTQWRDALQRGEFTVFYQPIWSLRGSAPRVVGAEALMRWVTSDHGVREPADFLPDLRRLGLLAEWDRHIRELVGHDVRRFYERDASFFIAVNVHPQDLTAPDIIDHLLAWPRTHGVPARCLHLEVLEDVRLPEQADALVWRLAQAGFALGIDDFGSGFAGFPYLERLPVTHIKLERHLVKDCDRQDRHARMIAGLVALARALGLEVVAEGVESLAVLRILQELRVDAAQGYALGRPMDRQSFAEWLTTVAASASARA